MSSRPKKHSLTIAGHRTSVSLEDEFWDALNYISKATRRSVPSLIAEIDAGRGNRGLSSAIRSAVLTYFREKAG